MLGECTLSESVMAEGGRSLDLFCSQTVLMVLQGRSGSGFTGWPCVRYFQRQCLVMTSRIAYYFEAAV